MLDLDTLLFLLFDMVYKPLNLRPKDRTKGAKAPRTIVLAVSIHTHIVRPRIFTIEGTVRLTRRHHANSLG